GGLGGGWGLGRVVFLGGDGGAALGPFLARAHAAPLTAGRSGLGMVASRGRSRRGSPPDGPPRKPAVLSRLLLGARPTRCPLSIPGLSEPVAAPQSPTAAMLSAGPPRVGGVT